MWGTSSPNDKLAGDLGNAIEGTRTDGRQSDFFTAGKLAPANLGLLQQYRHTPVIGPIQGNVRSWCCGAFAKYDRYSGNHILASVDRYATIPEVSI
jgi:hypothetical protein